MECSYFKQKSKQQAKKVSFEGWCGNFLSNIFQGAFGFAGITGSPGDDGRQVCKRRSLYYFKLFTPKIAI